MLPSRAELDSSLVFIAFLALFAALLTLRAVAAPHRLTRPVAQEGIELIGSCVAALLATVLATTELLPVLPIFLFCMNAAAATRYLVHRLSMPGILSLTCIGAGFLVGTAWSIQFILEAGLPTGLEVSALIGFGLAVPFMLVTQIATFAREAVLTHERWRLPFAAPAAPVLEKPFKVSLQLPCYAEPPEVVMETMNRLAALDYADYEVLVCDNNTKDEALWRPLEAHCAALNRRLGVERFRFFHVAPLPGAKAGALNWLMDKMDPTADLIGVVDADYFAKCDFLSRLAPFFADPQIGYIQTPHDYRGYQANSYLTAAYWEYMPCNKADYPGISEYGGAFTIGTMCLIRTEALRKAGGWAEWCLTEDSEVSVRIRAAGYRGYYFGETFGRGLIPETFDDYKKQRFRWTAGPVQQLRRHWRLFLPTPLAPRLPGWTKLLEVTRCLAPLQMLAGLAMAIAGMVAMVVALATGSMEPIDIPSIVPLLMLIGGATWWLRTVHRYRLAGCTDMEDMIRGEIARASLTYVILVAGLAGLSKRPLAWRRTPKFADQAAEPSPFASTKPETVAGGICLLIGVALLMSGGLLGSGAALLAFIGFASLGVQFLCAPLMAAMAIRRSSPVRMPVRRPVPPRVAQAHQAAPVMSMQPLPRHAEPAMASQSVH
ncbi:glycosyltransferase [Sphingobium nicotianae]|uniref:Beta-monoglucosyldiacylglycerol synthase n=1 Tax=Sphingobium nicotianae TaxID=2782607 RepID=A0A9X1DBM8_9SPHN|nr:glycosyltransferase [Sphingobium nicotianae]MBT2186890.1 glycosyltransferase [Sphingobium nicotianae]